MNPEFPLTPSKARIRFFPVIPPIEKFGIELEVRELARRSPYVLNKT